MKLPRWLIGAERTAARSSENADAWLERGASSQAKGDHAHALECFQRAWNLKPDSFEPRRALAFVWAALGHLDQAEYFAGAALQLEPASLPLRLLLADVLRRQQRLDEALAACEEAVRLAPQSPHARNSLGNALRDVGRPHEAIAQLNAALALDPRMPELYFNIALCLELAGEPDEAEKRYREALRLKPDFLEAWLNLAAAREQRDDLQGALEAYREALLCQPDQVGAHVNYAQHLLNLGRLEEGWKEYEWRWRLPEMAAWAPRLERPQWDGADVAGRTVLIYAEQGLGDAIHFARYVPLVAGRGGKPILRCPATLKPLLEAMPGIDRVVDERETLPPFDFCCPLLSLPRVFGTRLDTVPARVPYLAANARKVHEWARRLAAAGEAFHVGLVWTTDSKIAPYKALPIEALAPLGRVRGVVFHSLQTGTSAQQAAQAPAGLTLIDQSAELRDFSDTAALVANLDLVISIDTAVAHLAGAMAKPVWTLLAVPADWRWLVDREDSPWYPTMRLFRKPRGASWESLTAKVADALSKRAVERGDET